MGSVITDHRSASAVAYDALAEHVTSNNQKIDGLLSKLDEFLDSEKLSQRQHVEVIHKSQGMGVWGAAAVTACFFTSIMLLAISWIGDSVLRDIKDSIRDLQAWQQVDRKAIVDLQHKGDQR